MTTLLVDQDLCTRCGICSDVCTMGLIDAADENTLPKYRMQKPVCASGAGTAKLIARRRHSF